MPASICSCLRACMSSEQLLYFRDIVSGSSLTLVWAAVIVTRIDGGQRGGLAEPLPTGTARRSRRGEVSNSNERNSFVANRIGSGRRVGPRLQPHPQCSGSCKHKQSHNYDALRARNPRVLDRTCNSIKLGSSYQSKCNVIAGCYLQLYLGIEAFFSLGTEVEVLNRRVCVARSLLRKRWVVIG